MSASSLSPEDELQLLAAAHHLVGALLVAAGGLALIPIGTGVLLHAATDTAHGSTAWFDIYFVRYPLLGLPLLWALAAWLFLPGVNVSRREPRTFRRNTAAASLVCVPVGTVLGVLAMVVLTPPSVRAAFENTPSPTPADRG